VLALEWADPLFSAGHWVPEMVELAGGVPLLASPGDRSGRLEWAQVAAAPVDVLVHMPCGHPMATAVEEARALMLRPEVAGVPSVAAVHGDAYFSRPGPRLVDGVEILAGLLHPQVWPAPAQAAAVVLRP
jgi:iron complex transport system substrate-binding protein